MATFGQIIYYSMVTLIFIFLALIILILALTFTKSSTEVISVNAAPVAKIGQDELLSCFLSRATSAAGLTRVSVTWERRDPSGLVYKFDKGVPDLSNQDPQYKDRAQVLPTELASGNASLLLRNVKMGDAGVYACTISSSGGGGTVNIHLRTAAFSAPTFTVSNNTLRAVASSWFPEPSVTWENATGQALTGNTSVTSSSTRNFSVDSVLSPVNTSSFYTCRIANSLVAAVSEAAVTSDHNVSAKTFFTFSSAPSLLAPKFLKVMTWFLSIWFHRLTN